VKHRNRHVDRPSVAVAVKPIVETTSIVDVPSEPIAPVDVAPDAPVVAPDIPPSVVAMSPWVAPDGGDKPVAVNRHTGRYTGRGIEQFQNELYRWNRDGFASVAPDGTIRTIGLTDYEIAILWAVEFPGARCDYMAHVGYVASTRTDFVNGRHAAPASYAAGCAVTYGIDGKPATRPVRTPTKPTV